MKFNRGAAHASAAPASATDEVDPRSIMAALGQAELVPYVAPRRGLIIDKGGNA